MTRARVPARNSDLLVREQGRGEQRLVDLLHALVEPTFAPGAQHAQAAGGRGERGGVLLELLVRMSELVEWVGAFRPLGA